MVGKALEKKLLITTLFGISSTLILQSLIFGATPQGMSKLNSFVIKNRHPSCFCLFFLKQQYAVFWKVWKENDS